jgi:hypothetical protein
MSLASILLTVASLSNIIGYGIYFWMIIKDKIKPHGITYLIWSIIVGLNFAIQVISGVGKGSALLGINFAGCIMVFIFCYFKKHIAYDRIDWICFFLAILAVILWLITKTPVYSVILSCVIDLLAILPSFRKAFTKPYEDSALLFFISGLEYLLSFPAYQVLSFVILLYPVFVVTIDFSYTGLMLIRRMHLKD